MHRLYDVRVVALTIDAPAKWVDNLLSQHLVPGCEKSRRGVQRRISESGLRAIAAIRTLNSELALPVHAAVQLVRESDSPGLYRTQSGVRVELPWAQLEARLQTRLIDALQAAPRVPRGRRPRQ